MEHAQSLETGERWSVFVLFSPKLVSTRLVGEMGKRTYHETVRYGTRDMDRLHLLRKSANERIDGGVGKTCDAHAQCAQACELWYKPPHELPWTGSQIESAQARARAQELYDGVEESQIVIMSDERKTEGFEVR